MSTRENFSFDADLEVRGAEGRTVVGIAVPFDVPTDRYGHTEIFRRGAFARTIAERGPRVKFMVNHDHEALPVGRATLLREDARGLYSEFGVSKTRAGDEVLELIRDGALDSLSVGIKPVKDRWSADQRTREHLESALYEVSALAFTQFDADSPILEVRESGGLSVAEARARLDSLNPIGMTSADARRRFLTLTGA